ncbi:Uu.00g125510.m01.CDS01 [Anthostomella pinea]|uniref:Uu.00g125510.m01.CDS01 n=1 Tax=Anthostomella pinea TaxID=933095 RepID=A0AAI8VHT8_9PEZI|nr:Uu.00g125510.m01.CDS01 [Anthostomella pinea]
MRSKLGSGEMFTHVNILHLKAANETLERQPTNETHVQLFDFDRGRHNHVPLMAQAELPVDRYIREEGISTYEQCLAITLKLQEKPTFGYRLQDLYYNAIHQALRDRVEPPPGRSRRPEGGQRFRESNPDGVYATQAPGYQPEMVNSYQGFDNEVYPRYPSPMYEGMECTELLAIK